MWVKNSKLVNMAVGHKSEGSRRVRNRCILNGRCFRGDIECTNTKIEGTCVQNSEISTFFGVNEWSGGLELFEIVVYRVGNIFEVILSARELKRG